MDRRSSDREAEDLLAVHGSAAAQIAAERFIAAVRAGDEAETAYWLHVMLALKDRSAE